MNCKTALKTFSFYTIFFLLVGCYSAVNTYDDGLVQSDEVAQLEKLYVHNGIYSNVFNNHAFSFKVPRVRIAEQLFNTQILMHKGEVADVISPDGKRKGEAQALYITFGNPQVPSTRFRFILAHKLPWDKFSDATTRGLAEYLNRLSAYGDTAEIIARKPVRLNGREAMRIVAIQNVPNVGQLKHVIYIVNDKHFTLFLAGQLDAFQGEALLETFARSFVIR